MFGQPVFRARTTLRVDGVPGLQGLKVDCGLKSPAFLAELDTGRGGYFWKTRQASLSGDSTEYSLIWPASGSMRNGTCYRLPPSVPLNYERVSGFWPTPVGTESRRTTPYSQGGQNLTVMVGGPPNPRWTEWLMGFPVGWLALSVMPLARPLRNGSRVASSKRKQVRADG
jgi:hypothetical protein